MTYRGFPQTPWLEARRRKPWRSSTARASRRLEGPYMT